MRRIVAVLGILVSILVMLPVPLTLAEDRSYEQLSDVENKIRLSRQFYNDTVEAFNTAFMMFPTNLIAGKLGFQEEPFFRIEESEKAVPSVKF